MSEQGAKDKSTQNPQGTGGQTLPPGSTDGATNPSGQTPAPNGVLSPDETNIETDAGHLNAAESAYNQDFSKVSSDVINHSSQAAQDEQHLISDVQNMSKYDSALVKDQGTLDEDASKHPSEKSEATAFDSISHNAQNNASGTLNTWGNFQSQLDADIGDNSKGFDQLSQHDQQDFEHAAGQFASGQQSTPDSKATATDANTNTHRLPGQLGSEAQAEINQAEALLNNPTVKADIDDAQAVEHDTNQLTGNDSSKDADIWDRAHTDLEHHHEGDQGYKGSDVKSLVDYENQHPDAEFAGYKGGDQIGQSVEPAAFGVKDMTSTGVHGGDISQALGGDASALKGSGIAKQGIGPLGVAKDAHNVQREVNSLKHDEAHGQEATAQKDATLQIASLNGTENAAASKVLGKVIADEPLGGQPNLKDPNLATVAPFDPPASAKKLLEPNPKLLDVAAKTPNLNATALEGMKISGQTKDHPLGYTQLDNVVDNAYTPIVETHSSINQLNDDVQTLHDGVSSSNSAFQEKDGGQNLCFTTGTMIATREGEKAVQDLTIGDEVLTATGEYKPVAWIGHQDVIFDKNSEKPVTIKANALADGVPNKDLTVSAAHGLAFKVTAKGLFSKRTKEILARASSIVNSKTIVTSDARRATYWHVELQGGHNVIVANGAYAESFADHGERQFFTNVTHSKTSKIVRDCLPRMKKGKFIRALNKQISERARMLSYAKRKIV